MKNFLRRVANIFVDIDGQNYQGEKRIYPLTSLSKWLLGILITVGIISGGTYGYWRLNNFERTKIVEAFSLSSAFKLSAVEEACGIKPDPNTSSKNWKDDWRLGWTDLIDDGETVYIAQFAEGEFTYKGYATTFRVEAGPHGPVLLNGSVRGEVAEKFLQVAMEEIPPLNYAEVDTLGGPDESKLNSPAKVFCRRDFSYDWRTPWD